MTGASHQERHLVSLPWSDYELLDSGENMKLERFGGIVVARPETQALWKKLKPELWDSAHAEFAFRLPAQAGDQKGLPASRQGAWDVRKPVPESWELSWRDVRFLARLTGFKHTGVFPEQAPNWEWLAEKISKLERPNVLNLFGYTGIASLVAAKAGLRLAGAGSGHAEAGAFVTHVDASKQSLDWAHENARLSGIPEDAIRWIPDDALAFAKREARRGARYDGIVLDPPAFGRGAKGEVWKIEEDLPTLLDALKSIFSNVPGSFFLLNGYAAGYAPRSFAQAIGSVFPAESGEYGLPAQAGELHIKESSSERVIPAGIYVRFARHTTDSVAGFVR